MPKSKRDKKVSLTETKRKGLEFKQKLVDEVRGCVDTYERLFVLSVENMRNTKLKDVRTAWKHSRFFFGKNKVIMLAFGKHPESEYKDSLHKITEKLQGNVGLLFTNKTKEEVLEWFKTYTEPEFARSGNKATELVVLPEGPLDQFGHSMEPHLRQLGLPTELKKGVIHLRSEHTVCKVGDVLTPEQARILKLLGKQTVKFAIKLDYMWSSDGKLEELKSSCLT
ncbi:mRNA turnover protein 4 homolog [Apostichopus japonicus]|uniref:mRNA turnover protein 4 homolog n=1 Tax=Stichopus japonicus TaxID=307972 RepID=UPI003AB5B967